VSSAATGLIIATGLKMTRPLSDSRWQIPIAALAFVALAIVRVPLLWALAALVPISVALAWRTRR
jgi:chromate transporter